MEHSQPPKYFRDKVRQEARLQRELRSAGQKVPSELKKYARLSGLVMIIAPVFGLFVLFLIAKNSGTVSVGVTLFFCFFILLGLIQLVTGRHFLARR